MSTDYTILLPFRETPGARHDTAYLTRESGRIVACNGHAIACLPDDGTQSVREASVAYTELLNKYPALGEYVPLLDATTVPAVEHCYVCAGTGRVVLSACGDCEGKGVFDRGQHTYHCKNCDGGGQTITPISDITAVNCPECTGAGSTPEEPRKPCLVLGHPYDPRNVAKLSKLPDVRVAHAGTPDHPAALRIEFAGGGTGLLLGWRI